MSRAGWPWRLLARAPTDPYVLALEHTVPQPADLPPAKDPEAIRSSYVDMAWNLEVFRMFPSIESAGRRFASLHRVLRGEFPCFISTIKALRLPAARPAALRFLSLETSRVVFSFFGGCLRRSFANATVDRGWMQSTGLLSCPLTASDSIRDSALSSPIWDKANRVTRACHLERIVPKHDR